MTPPNPEEERIQKRTRRDQLKGRVISLFLNEKIQAILKKNQVKYLEFSDIQYILCERQPRKLVWSNKWRDIATKIREKAPLFNNILELQRTLEELCRDDNVLIRIDRGKYILREGAFSPNEELFRQLHMKIDHQNRIMEMREGTYHILYPGIDIQLGDNIRYEQISAVTKRLITVFDEIAPEIMTVWISTQLEVYCKNYEEAMKKVHGNEKWMMIGFTGLHVRQWLADLGKEESDYNEILDTLDGKGILDKYEFAFAKDFRDKFAKVRNETRKALNSIRSEVWVRQYEELTEEEKSSYGSSQKKEIWADYVMPSGIIKIALEKGVITPDQAKILRLYLLAEKYCILNGISNLNPYTPSVVLLQIPVL